MCICKSTRTNLHKNKTFQFPTRSVNSFLKYGLRSQNRLFEGNNIAVIIMAWLGIYLHRHVSSAVKYHESLTVFVSSYYPNSNKSFENCPLNSKCGSLSSRSRKVE